MAVESGFSEREDVKKRALLRLVVAGVITAAAVLGLWWLDQDGNPESKASSAPPSPAPIVAANPQEAALPLTEPAAAEVNPPAVSETAAPDPAMAPVSEPADLPPPPKVSNTPRPAPTPIASSLPAASAAAAPAPAPAPAPSSARSPAPQAPPPTSRPPGTPAPAANQNFVVQLGVFNNPDNARDLLDKLNKQGVNAHLEARVQMGPFLTRAEAEKAQAALHRLGYSALVTAGYPASPAK